MTKKELKEKQSLYLSMVDEDTKKMIQTLDTYQISKKNCMLVYGFMVYMSQKDVDYTKLQSTGRQANAYKLNTKDDINWIISSLKTISTWTGVCINSVQTSIQYLINLGVIETKKDLDKQELICKSDTLYLNSISKSKANCIDCLSDLEYKRLYNEIKTDLKMELIEMITETINNATNKLKVELEKYIDEKLDNIKSELIENRQVAIDATASNNNPNWIKLKEKRDRVWESINKFIDTIPTLSPTQIEDCCAKYVKALSNGCYDRQDYLDNAITNLNSRVSKAKLNAIKSITPPDHLLKELPAPNKTSTQDFVNSLVWYIQVAEEQLAKDSRNNEYKDKIDGYKQWHYQNLIKNFAPALKELREDLDTDEKVLQIWNQNVSQLGHSEFMF